MYLYLHIPFCSQKCIYCDFYSKVNFSGISEYVEALKSEIRLRSFKARTDRPEHTRLKTIYLGGGTPSLLTPLQLADIFREIEDNFCLDDLEEVTLEMNPDDVTPVFLKGIAPLPINRLSMGVQSWWDDDLKFLRRRHTAEDARRAVALCKDAGYDRISLDLIYGLPGQTPDRWEYNIEKTLELDPGHISAYHLIYEEGTPLDRLVDAGKVKPIDEELSLQMFRLLIDKLAEGGYEQYEISNFAVPGACAVHNSAYWKNLPYLGLGPSAHSYDGRGLRRANLPNTKAYIEALRRGLDAPHENELLTYENMHDEKIMCGLRTRWGIDLASYDAVYHRKDRLLQEASPYISQGLMKVEDGRLLLTRDGIFVSDGIMSDLFL